MDSTTELYPRSRSEWSAARQTSLPAPSPPAFDERIGKTVAAAVAEAARKSGAARL